MGHAGAIIGGANDTAQAKMDALRACGVLVAESPADLGSSMAKAFPMSGVAASSRLPAGDGGRWPPLATG